MKQPILGKVSPIIPAGSDMEKAIAFYEQQLGFTTIYQEGDPVTMAIVKRDSVEIYLQKNDDKHLAEWTNFRIQVDGIEQLYQELQTNGGQMGVAEWKYESGDRIKLAGAVRPQRHGTVLEIIYY